MSKKIAALGTRPGDNNTKIGVSSDCTRPSDSNQFSAIDDLMGQAERRMRCDPERYDCHFMIWLSLFSLKNGSPRR